MKISANHSQKLGQKFSDCISQLRRLRKIIFLSCHEFVDLVGRLVSTWFAVGCHYCAVVSVLFSTHFSTNVQNIFQVVDDLHDMVHV